MTGGFSGGRAESGSPLARFRLESRYWLEGESKMADGSLTPAKMGRDGEGEKKEGREIGFTILPLPAWYALRDARL